MEQSDERGFGQTIHQLVVGIRFVSPWRTLSTTAKNEQRGEKKKTESDAFDIEPGTNSRINGPVHCVQCNTIMAIYPLSIDNCFFLFLKHRLLADRYPFDFLFGVSLFRHNCSNGPSFYIAIIRRACLYSQSTRHATGGLFRENIFAGVASIYRCSLPCIRLFSRCWRRYWKTFSLQKKKLDVSSPDPRSFRNCGPSHL